MLSRGALFLFIKRRRCEVSSSGSAEGGCAARNGEQQRQLIASRRVMLPLADPSRCRIEALELGHRSCHLFFMELDYSVAHWLLFRAII